jgi:hypothetical protein
MERMAHLIEVVRGSLRRQAAEEAERRAETSAPQG